MSRFSIVIPVYNVEPYLRECLDSVFNQSYRDFEVCIVDDGSKDESGRICDEYKEKYEGIVTIKLQHQVNQGVSEARNRALDMATGDFIWFVDADDYLLSSDALNYLNIILDKTRADTLIFGKEGFDTTPSYDSYNNFDKNEFLLKNVCYCNPLMIFSRKIIENYAIRFSKGMRMGEDLEFQFKYLVHCNNLCAIKYNFYYIRLRDGSASRNKQSQINNLNDNGVAIKNLIKYLKQEEVEEQSWITLRLIERLQGYLTSVALIGENNWGTINAEYRDIVKEICEYGFPILKKLSLRLAMIDVRVFVYLWKLLMIFKRL